MKSKILSIAIAFFVLLSFFSIQALAENTDGTDVLYHGFEIDNIITLISSILAVVLFIFTFIAYRRSGRSRLLYVAAAFLLFAIKGFVQTSDMFITYDKNWIDPLATLFDFAVLLLFFFGIIKR